MNRIPEEILCEILEYVFLLEKTDIANLCLVSKFFNETVKTHFWYDTQKDISKLCRLIKNCLKKRKTVIRNMGQVQIKLFNKTRNDTQVKNIEYCDLDTLLSEETDYKSRQELIKTVFPKEWLLGEEIYLEKLINKVITTYKYNNSSVEFVEENIL